MRHNTHCHACGTAMLPNDANCANPDCGIPANQEPVWPWERCAGCNERWIGPRLGLQILIACILTLVAIDILALSGCFLIVAGVLTVGWFINRLMYAWVLATEDELAEQTAKAETAQQDFNRLGSPTPEDKKKLKDEHDKLRSLDWKLARNIWWRRNVFITQAVIILLIGLTFGPGKVIPWTAKDVALITSHEVVNSNIAEEGKELWSEAQTKQLWNLLRERDVTYAEFNTIVANANYNAAIAVDTVKKSNKIGHNLKTEIISAFPATTQPAVSPAPTLPEKSNFQRYREIIWLIYLVACGICLFIWAGMIGVGFITLFMQIGHGFASEIWDQINLKVDQVLEKKGITSSSGAEKTASTVGAMAGLSGHGVFNSIIGSSLADFLMRLLLKKKVD